MELASEMYTSMENGNPRRSQYRKDKWLDVQPQKRVTFQLSSSMVHPMILVNIYTYGIYKSRNRGLKFTYVAADINPYFPPCLPC